MATPTQKDWHRPTAVAGTFYPRDPEKLKKQLSQLLPASAERTVRAVMAPHAGYIYSGKFAGQVYSQVKIPERVVVLCPNHTGEGKRISVWAHGSWESPLGDVAVDETFARAFLANYPDARADRDAHEYEHAIEVHLPFLQWREPRVQIVPIVLGPLQLDACEAIGRTLAKVVAEFAEPTLIVASSDMSHYLAAEEAKRRDAFALAAIERRSPRELYQSVIQHDISMCGFIPTTATLAAANQLQVRESSVVCYGHSGEASGDYERVVAYAGAILE